MALGSQLGVTPSIDTVYADQSSDYCTYTPPTTSLTLMVGIGNCTAAQVAAIGQNLINAGQSHAIIRVMWEQNQDLAGWFQGWNQLTFPTAASTSPIFQSTVTTMRAGPGVHASCGTRMAGPPTRRPDARGQDTWPGKAYVNLVGVDQYDCPGYAANVQAVVAFAHSQGLPVAIPEWGLNGTDDPSFINGMVGLIEQPRQRHRPSRRTSATPAPPTPTSPSSRRPRRRTRPTSDDAIDLTRRTATHEAAD